MKRILSLLLSVLFLCLLLPGCEQLAATEQESRSPAFQPTPTPSQTDPPAEPTEDSSAPGAVPDGLSSNWKDVATFTDFPDGNYLADPKFDTDEFLPGYDVDVSFLTVTDHIGVCATEDTIFFSPNNGSLNRSSFLHFTDIASGVTMPLCSKPECSHTDDTCNAYLASSGQVYGLRIYDGKLYWLAYEDHYVQLMRMNFDGTGHEVVTSLDLDASQKINALNGTTWFIHRGYIYIGGFDRYYNELVEPVEYYVCATPISGGETFPIMSCVQNCTGSLIYIIPKGNDLYISLNSYQQDIDETVPYLTAAFYRWSSKTREGEYLFGQEGLEEDCHAYAKGGRPFPVGGGDLYYKSAPYDEGTDANAVAIWKLSSQTKQIEEVGAFPGQSAAFLVEGGIVSYDSSRVYLYDYDFNLLSQSDPADLTILYNFLGANSQYAFFLCFDADNAEDIIAVPLHGGDPLMLQGAN